jgi:hypothetical protein
VSLAGLCSSLYPSTSLVCMLSKRRGKRNQERRPYSDPTRLLKLSVKVLGRALRHLQRARASAALAQDSFDVHRGPCRRRTSRRTRRRMTCARDRSNKLSVNQTVRVCGHQRRKEIILSSPSHPRQDSALPAAVARSVPERCLHSALIMFFSPTKPAFPLSIADVWP